MISRRQYIIVGGLFIAWVAISFFFGGPPDNCNELRHMGC